MSEPETLLTVKEYAALTRQHPESVRKRIREKRFRWPIDRESDRGWIRIRVPSSFVAQRTQQSA